MKVKILPLGYIGHIVEQGLVFQTVRLASGTLVLTPISLIEPIECSNAQGNPINDGNGQPDNARLLKLGEHEIKGGAQGVDI
jgi:hypothetical protein